MLLSSDFSKQLPTGWRLGPGWKAAEGALLFDGTNTGNDAGSMAFLPPLPLGRAYAVDATIDLIRKTSGIDYSHGFGLGVRMWGTGQSLRGYLAGWRWRDRGRGGTLLISTEDEDNRLAESDYPLEPGVHRFRCEVSGNTLKLSIDQFDVATQDNAYLEPGSVGVWCEAYQISVRSIVVTAL